MKPLYIYDLDGTLALTHHRQHILDDKTRPDRWKAFFAACVNDAPNTSVLETMQHLLFFADVWIWSGRSSDVRQQTIEWLANHSCLMTHDIDKILLMRDEGDFTPDEELKESWLHNLSHVDRRRLVAVFDDRDKVVAMWRKNGVPCFQVAPGAF